MFDLPTVLGKVSLNKTPANLLSAEGVMFDIEFVKPGIYKARFMATSTILSSYSCEEFGNCLINLTTYFEGAVDSQRHSIDPATLVGRTWMVRFELNFGDNSDDLPIAYRVMVMRLIPHGMTQIVPTEQEEQTAEEQPLYAPCLLNNPFLCPLENTGVPGEFAPTTELPPLFIDDIPLAKPYLERFIGLLDIASLNWEPKKDHLAIIRTLATEAVQQKLSSNPNASMVGAALTMSVPMHSDAVVCHITLNLDCEIDVEYGHLYHSDIYEDFLHDFPDSLSDPHLPEWRFRAWLNVEYEPLLFS